MCGEPTAPVEISQVRELINNETPIDPGAAFQPKPMRVIVAAGGKGTRFLGTEAKVVASGQHEVPLIIRVLCAVLAIDPCPVVVTRSSTRAAIERAVDRFDLEVDLVDQDESLPGMGGAVLTGIKHGVRSQSLITVWGDMGMIWAPNILLTAVLHQLLGASMSFPTRIRQEPYVATLRDMTGQPCDFLFRKLGHAMPSVGESDCGVFAFNTEHLTSVLESEAATFRGRSTELDLLPVVRRFAADDLPRFALHIARRTDSQGVNTLDELCQADDYYTTAIRRTAAAYRAVGSAQEFAETACQFSIQPPIREQFALQARSLNVDSQLLPPGLRRQLDLAIDPNGTTMA